MKTAYTLGKIAAFKGRPLITVGGGRVITDFADTGSGHISPATAIYEALSEHPAVRKGNVLLQGLFPETLSLKKDIPYAKGVSDVGVFSGFSGLADDPIKWEGVPEGVDPAGYRRYLRATKHRVKNPVRFISDTPVSPFTLDRVREIVRQFSEDPRAAFTELRNVTRLTSMKDLPRQTRKAITTAGRLGSRILDRYTPGSIEFGSAGTPLITPRKVMTASKISPALTNKALEGVHAALSAREAALRGASGVTAEQVYEEFAKHLEGAGNKRAARYIRAGIDKARQAGRAYQPILVTGSSRGDYVAQKTVDLVNALRKHKLQDEFHVIPLLGRNINITSPLVKTVGIPPMPGTPPDLYNKLRGFARLNLASTGASDINELKALPAPALVHADQAKLKRREINNLVTRYNQIKHKFPKQARDLLESIATYVWNYGNIKDIERAQAAGLGTYRNAEEIVKYLKDPEFMNEAKNVQRARTMYDTAQKYKKDLADKLVTMAKREAGTPMLAGALGRAVRSFRTLAKYLGPM